MAYNACTADLCGQDKCVLSAHTPPRKSFWQRVLDGLRPRPSIPHIRDLNDRMARDIGLTPAEMERHRIKLPSQSTYHPRG